MFEHSEFEELEFSEIPLDRDIYLVSDALIPEYHSEMLSLFNGTGSNWRGPITSVAARAVHVSNAELSWYANVSNRFHEIKISLPSEQFVLCIATPAYDEKTCIFVRDMWLEQLHQRSFSVFVLIDAIGVKNALAGGGLTRSKLAELRSEIDMIAEEFPDVSFVSFADSLLLKSNWFSGYHDKGIKGDYAPEVFFEIIKKVQEAYRKSLGLKIYSVLTQGSNEFYDDALLHISNSKNHISLNSLGLPFAQLIKIEEAARQSIRSKLHPPADLYMDDCFYHSLKFQFEFDKWHLPHFDYMAPMSSIPCTYFCSSLDAILQNIR